MVLWRYLEELELQDSVYAIQMHDCVRDPHRWMCLSDIEISLGCQKLLFGMGATPSQ